MRKESPDIFEDMISSICFICSKNAGSLAKSTINVQNAFADNFRVDGDGSNIKQACLEFVRQHHEMNASTWDMRMALMM